MNINIETSSISNRCKGSALVEAILICSVMSISMAGIPMISKLIDLRQKSIESSRYVAWEKTLSDDDMAAQQVQFKNRFFRDPSAPISSLESDVRSNHFWGDRADDSRHADEYESREDFYLSRSHVSINEGSVSASVTGVELNEGLGVAKIAGAAISKAGGFIGGQKWGLPDNGLVSSQVKLDVNKNALLTESGAGCGTDSGAFGCIEENTSILSNGWSVENYTQMARRTKSFVPTSRIREVGKVISYVGYIPFLKELKGLKRAFGCVESTVMPGKTTSELPYYSDNTDSGRQCE